MSVLRRGRRVAALVALVCTLAVPVSTSRSLADEGGAPAYKSYNAVVSNAALETPLISAKPLRSDEPFGIVVTGPVEGGIQNKWRAVDIRLPREHRILMRCRAQAAGCPPAAQRFLAVIDRAQTRDGWARIADVNRTINLDIRPVSDMAQYGVADLWATPLMAFKSNAGDCEDYAIAKYVALHELGIASSDLRIIAVHDNDTNEDHAVAAVRYEGHWLILDNRTSEMRSDTDIAAFKPMFVVDGDNVKGVSAWGLAPSEAGTEVETSINGYNSLGLRTVQLLL